MFIKHTKIAQNRHNGALLLLIIWSSMLIRRICEELYFWVIFEKFHVPVISISACSMGKIIVLQNDLGESYYMQQTRMFSHERLLRNLHFCPILWKYHFSYNFLTDAILEIFFKGDRSRGSFQPKETIQVHSRKRKISKMLMKWTFNFLQFLFSGKGNEEIDLLL